MGDSVLSPDLPQQVASALARLMGEGSLAHNLARYGHPRLIRHGRSLCNQGEIPDAICLVLEGRLKRFKYRTDDSLSPLPGLLPGDWSGLAEFLTNSPFLAEVVAEENCLVLAFSPANFRTLGELCPQLTGQLVPAALARELVVIHSQLADAGPLDRIVTYLLGRRRQIGGTVNSSVGITQAELGRMVGCTRETVNKYLGLLAQRGLVVVERRSLGIPDWEALANYQ